MKLGGNERMTFAFGGNDISVRSISKRWIRASGEKVTIQYLFEMKSNWVTRCGLYGMRIYRIPSRQSQMSTSLVV
jgi:hypothetical protein